MAGIQGLKQVHTLREGYCFRTRRFLWSEVTFEFSSGAPTRDHAMQRVHSELIADMGNTSVLYWVAGFGQAMTGGEKLDHIVCLGRRWQCTPPTQDLAKLTCVY